MRRLFALIMLLAAAPALADAEARVGSDWVRITARPCSNDKVVGHILAAGRNALDFRAATARFQGQDYSACWTPGGPGVVLVYEDGDTGMVPARDLKPVPEA